MDDVFKTIFRRIWISFIVLISLAIAGAGIKFLFPALGAIGNLAALPVAESAERSLVVILVIAFLTMSIVQSLRSIVPFRGWFHAYSIRQHFLVTETDIEEVKKEVKKAGSHQEQEMSKARKKAEDNLTTLLALANARDKVAFLNLPIEQVTGQINAVAELLMAELAAPMPFRDDTQDKKRHLLTSLAGPKGAKDALFYFGALPSQSELTEEDRITLRERLAYHIQRNIDQLQIGAKTGWQRSLRLVAVGTSSAIAVNLIQIDYRNTWISIVKLLVIGLLAGYIASVFRDTVAILERLRR